MITYGCWVGRCMKYWGCTRLKSSVRFSDSRSSATTPTTTGRSWCASCGTSGRSTRTPTWPRSLRWPRTRCSTTNRRAAPSTAFRPRGSWRAPATSWTSRASRTSSTAWVERERVSICARVAGLVSVWYRCRRWFAGERFYPYRLHAPCARGERLFDSNQDSLSLSDKLSEFN